jgi:AcrR family transcriptional regulator/DNA-binding MarR family transcriptional regulator
MTYMVSEHGLAETSVARVVTRAGVSRRTYYELFEDREQCFLAALDDAIARVSEHVVVAYRSGEEWSERVRLALAALLEFLDVEPRTGWLLVVGSLQAGARALECRRRVVVQIIAVVDGGRAEAKSRAELPPLTAEGIVGAVLAVIHARLLDGEGGRLVELANQLMSMIVLPYLGPVASRRELRRAPIETRGRLHELPCDPLIELEMRLTYRTVRVLMAVAGNPEASNKEIGEAAGAYDQGQISKLLARLERLGLVRNTNLEVTPGARNAWTLTARGLQVQDALAR